MPIASHSLRRFALLLIVLMLSVWLSACATTTSPATTGVMFNIHVPVDGFSPTAALQVGVWNAQQLEQLDRQAECVVSVDVQTQAETIHCPEGVQYQKIAPEEFVFPVQSIKESIQFTSQTVKAGEKYQLVLRGLSDDGCNTLSATIESTAPTSSIKLDSLQWTSTDMACVTAP